jgi:O-antigen/teichoic acid export membrane protein
VALYGEELEPYGYLVVVLAARNAISVAGFGPSIAVKVAGLVREMFLARLAVAVLSLPTAVVATSRYGLTGAAAAGVAITVVLVVVMYCVYIPGVVRVRRNRDTREPPTQAQLLTSPPAAARPQSS